MCGIFAYAGPRSDAAELTLQGLKELEYRGYDSWGVAALSADDRLEVTKQVGKIGDAQLETHDQGPIHEALGHTRWATHGGVTVANAHPHLDEHRQLAVVHNGIIENFEPLRRSLIKKGHQFVSQTDTEVAAHLLEEELPHHASLSSSLRAAFLQLTGLNSLVVIHAPTHTLAAAKHGSPLAVGKIERGFIVASDAVALSPYTHTVHYLEDGELVAWEKGKLQLYSIKTGKKKPFRWQKLEFSAQSVSKEEYPHFMLKEIHEQPRVLHAVATEKQAEIEAFARTLKKHVILVGCGTAYHAALVGAYLLTKYTARRAIALTGSEAGPWLDQAQARDTSVVFLSQSGETIDIVEHATALKERKMKIHAIVNRLGSTLERMADYKITLPAGPEICVLATKSFTAKYAALVSVTAALGSAAQRRELEKALSQLPEAVTAVLTEKYRTQVIRPVARTCQSAQHLFVIGRGMAASLAFEFALKIKEVTYIHAEGFAGGELKHGVIALIEQGTPCVVFAQDDDTRAAILSNAQELKARGARIIGVGPVNDEVFDDWLNVPEVGLTTGVGQIMVGQLLAYEMALLLGRDPDKPRNLAKSVTVK